MRVPTSKCRDNNKYMVTNNIKYSVISITNIISFDMIIMVHFVVLEFKYNVAFWVSPSKESKPPTNIHSYNEAHLDAFS